MIDAKILIADDQPAILESLDLLLKPHGCELRFVSTPEEALEAVRATSFDLLIMDLNYAQGSTSGEEGLSLLDRIEEYDRTLPVVVMTAWSSVEVAVKAMRGRLRDFVQKPWDNAKMLEILERQIGQGRSLRTRSRELDEAREIQRRLLPESLPSVPGYSIATAWEPAQTVAGDYFDILDLGDGRSVLCIGDVVGKGMPAALLMSNVQAAVRAYATPKASPEEICGRLNQTVCGNIAANKFISFVYGILDRQSGRFDCVNAGHNAPIVVRADGLTLKIDSSGLALGIDETTSYSATGVSLGSGDRLLLYTDGLTEAGESSGEPYGLARLERRLIEQRRTEVRGTLDLVMNDVREYDREQHDDDVTAILLARN